MTRTGLVALAAAATMAAGGCQRSAAEPSTGTMADAMAATLAIKVEGCETLIPRTATAVLIGPDLAATVAHTFVVDGAISVGALTVETAGNEAAAVELVHLDPARDIALLRIEAGTDEAWPDHLELANQPIEEDAEANLVLDQQVVAARVVERATATLDGEGARAAFRLDVGVERGDSGAPVIDDAGHVAGIVFATVRSYPGADPTGSWAVAASEISAAIAAGTESIAWTCP